MFVKSVVIEDTVVVETKSKVALLSRITNLCTAVCKHGLSDTVNQGNVANLNVAFDHMVFDVEMTDPAKFVGIACKEFGASKIRVYSIGFAGWL